MYVAFMDVLGFSSSILTDFNKVVELYQRLIQDVQVIEGLDADVSVQIYSNSLLVSCKKLSPLSFIVCFLQQQILRSGFLVRGGIGFGRHLEVQENNNTFLVSEALVHVL
jgi:hypothetical protein